MFHIPHTHKRNVCMFQFFFIFFFLHTHQKKKFLNWHSLSDCPSDISAAVSSETQSWSPAKQVHPKENSCRAVIWQKEHHSTSAVLLSSLTYCQVPGTLPECWHTKYHSSHSTGVLLSLFTGPRYYPSTDITFSFPWRHVSISEAGTIKVFRCLMIFCYNWSWNMALKWLTQTIPGTRLLQLTGQKQSQSSAQGIPTQILQSSDTYLASCSAISAPTIACYCDLASL